MSTHKKIDVVCVVVILCAALITILFMNGSRLGLTLVVDEDSQLHKGEEYFTANDLNGAWTSASATVITLEGDYARVSGKGAYTNDGSVYITEAGYYEVSGTLTDGSIVVDAHKASKVWILLNGVDIYCSDDAALIVDQAEKVFVTLAEGSENILASGSEYSKEALEDNTSAVIFAHDDLTINGSGSLTVIGEYRHGILAKDELVITGGTITVTAPEDGIRANDGLRICNAQIMVTAGDDGLVVNHEDSLLYIQSGSIQIDSEDDGIHTASDILIDGGELIIAAGDDGIHSDTSFYIAGGSIYIGECYEGIEAVTIDIEEGDITIYPSDDGLNANGGSGDFFGMGGMRSFQQGDSDGSEAEAEAAAEEAREAGADLSADDQSEMTENETMAEENTENDETYIRISGGTLTIINKTAQDADGMDSNGDIYITGGTIRISLVNSGTNSAIDYASESNGVCEISGGTVIAAGSYTMAEQFDTTSTQPSILYTYSSGAAEGTTVSLEDAEGNVLLSWEVPCSFSSVNVSCPEMTIGETYTVVIGDEVEEVTLAEVSASYGDAQSGGFGGTMNFGGMQPRGGMGDGEMPDFSNMENGESEGGRQGGSRGERQNGEAMPEEAQEFASDNEAEAPDIAAAPGSDAADDTASRPSMDENAAFEERNFGQPFADYDDNAEEETTASNKVELSELDANVWIWLGISALVLIAGIAFAVLYRKGRL